VLHASTTLVDRVDLATPAIAVLSTGCRPLGSCSRAAGWSAATSCCGPKANKVEVLPRSGCLFAAAKLADIPFVQPTKFDLVANVKAAQEIGLTLPQSLLLPRVIRADQSVLTPSIRGG
jgi:hypothetical protein